MKKIIICSWIGISVALLTGCGENPNTTGGTVIGAVAGGLIGSQFGGGSGKIVATIAGAAIGGYIGNRIGQYMDRQDQMNYQSAVANTPMGQQAQWTNTQTQVTYTVRPVNQYYQTGRVCRRYKTTVIIKGKEREAYGVACKDAYGHWRIEN